LPGIPGPSASGAPEDVPFSDVEQGQSDDAPKALAVQEQRNPFRILQAKITKNPIKSSLAVLIPSAVAAGFSLDKMVQTRKRLQLDLPEELLFTSVAFFALFGFFVCCRVFVYCRAVFCFGFV
jgi:hypothetical protein